MLLNLLMLISLIPTLLGWGKLFYTMIGKHTSDLSFTIFAGIFSCTIAGTVISFFYPLNGIIEVIFISVGLISFFIYKVKYRLWNFLKNYYTFFIPISIFLVFLGSFFPFILDHFGYYIPTINWLSQYGLVKGISNLDMLLGQMSFWHIFQTLFSHYTDAYLRINVLLLVVYLIYILEKKSWIHFAFLPFLALFIQSPSPDLPVFVFSLMILNEILTKGKSAPHLFTFSVFVIAIKITAIWLPIFVFFYATLYLKNKQIKYYLPGILILILVLFKNLWTFGFPLFPMQIVDLGIFWKPNQHLLINSNKVAQIKTFDMQFNYETVKSFTIFEYIKDWLLLSGIKGFINVLLIILMISFLVYSFIKKEMIIWILFSSILIKTIAVLLFSAQYRFFIDVFFVIAFVFFYNKITKKQSLQIFSISGLLVVIFLSFPHLVKSVFPSFRLGSYLTGFPNNQWIRPAYFQLNKFSTHQIGNLKFNIVENYPFSFDTPLPAISPDYLREDLEAGIFPQRIGSDFKEGFVWRKMTTEEKMQLKDILDKLNK